MPTPPKVDKMSMKSQEIILIEYYVHAIVEKIISKSWILAQNPWGVIIGLSSIITPTTTTSVFGGNIWEAMIIIVLPEEQQKNKA